MAMNSKLMILSRPFYSVDSHCGYCNGEKEDHLALESQFLNQSSSPSLIDNASKSHSMGFVVEQMTCQQYDFMINKGCRRSGTYVYKPDLLRSCCRLYTIRTKLNNLKLDKHHRKAINRFIKEISNDDDNKEKQPTHKNQQRYDIRDLIRAEQKSTKFRTVFEPSGFSKEKFELYKKYQIKVHNDEPSDVTESSFKRFLCQTPFDVEEVLGNDEEWKDLNNWVANWSLENDSSGMNHKRIGPTHVCYYLEDKLIAVSVLDFLPTGVSSIYFIWDPDYAHLSLGTLSGLREILMCEELKLGYYYLGYYIDDCPKMNYKSKFGGEILDLVNNMYVPLDKVKSDLKNGRLFVLGSTTDNGTEELKLSDDYPKDWDNTKSENISEILYGEHSSIYDGAEKDLNLIKKQYKIDFTQKKGFFHAKKPPIPSVYPGLKPLYQVIDILDSDALDDDFCIIFYNNSTGIPTRSYFSDMTSLEKSIVIEYIRLFGIEFIDRSVIFV
ncbi:arginine-tRNA-protein transferase [Scheffersomyces coipomensis]|uniref:arginine-tRNA-protein transferase n=1 Tax=Scheffersomyces coipomensis TaxID=1788519 RepID=UPI00315D1A2C